MLLVDDRESEKVKAKLLMRLGDADLGKDGNMKVRRLPTGDYVMGTWGIEAKEINDLYRSIIGMGRNRTIVDQLRDLQDDFENPILVVYGTKYKPYVVGKGTPNSKSMAIELARMKKVNQTFKMQFYQRFPKIKYMELLTMDDFCDWLVSNHTQMSIQGAVTRDRLPAKEKKIHDMKKLDNRIKALSSIEGVSVEAAEKLLDKFGSIPKILNSKTTQKSLMEVQGIGRGRAKDILALRDKYSN